MRTGSRDRGSASVLLLAVGAVTLLLAAAGASYGAAVVARHRARSAADLGALAGAVHAAEGATGACAAARVIAEANGGRLAGCAVDGLDVTVTVEVTPAGGVPGTARISARAGPVRAPE